MARNILIAGAGVTAISQERDRQIQVEGWTPEHDAQHSNGELAKAAGCYALADDAREKCNGNISEPFKFWPWAKEWWKPSPDNRIKELAKAGALIAAEIDRLVALEKEAEK